MQATTYGQLQEGVTLAEYEKKITDALVKYHLIKSGAKVKNLIRASYLKGLTISDTISSIVMSN